MSDELTKRYKKLEEAIIKAVPGADVGRIGKAFDFARTAHASQLRNDGTPFATHPLATAELVVEMGLDEDSICAALLHDCIEDTTATVEEIEKLFGKDVAAMVDGVTKLTRGKYTSKEEEQMENLRKMLIAMVRDIRVIMIKIADRLHNMRTMEYVSDYKRREKARETMEIYAPIAHRLGMQKFKWELEDLSITYLDPIGCEKIQRGLSSQHSRDETFLHRVQERIEARMADNGVDCVVFGRVKHLYSIYRKMYGQNKELAEVLDLFAFRVIVEDIEDCYHAMGIVHELYHPIPNKIKDYISNPKPNDYRSLHTTVISREGIPFEVQIRTRGMNEMAEYGIAAHWKYKEGIGGKIDDEEKFAWVRRLIESQQDSDPQDFFQALKTDMFADTVYVLTPKGDVVSLPAGSTPIDFAYGIHSEVGNRMTGAIVNRRMVPYHYVLENGDIIEVLTSNSSKGPSRDWLNIIKSPEARNKIRQWFKKEKREENIIHGKMALESELRHANLKLSDITGDDILPQILSRLKYGTLDELFAAIGYGGISAQKVVNRIRDEARAASKSKKNEDPVKLANDSNSTDKTKSIQGVTVHGLDNCEIKFAQCCMPVPGDLIVGYVTRGFGVSVHRQDCANYRRSADTGDKEDRWAPVAWADTEGRSYSTVIYAASGDRTGLIVDIASGLNALNVKLTSFKAKNTGTDTVSIEVVIAVKNRDELIMAMARLMSVSGVTDVRRASG